MFHRFSSFLAALSLITYHGIFLCGLGTFSFVSSVSAFAGTPPSELIVYLSFADNYADAEFRDYFHSFDAKRLRAVHDGIKITVPKTYLGVFRHVAKPGIQCKEGMTGQETNQKRAFECYCEPYTYQPPALQSHTFLQEGHVLKSYITEKTLALQSLRHCYFRNSDATPSQGGHSIAVVFTDRPLHTEESPDVNLTIDELHESTSFGKKCVIFVVPQHMYETYINYLIKDSPGCVTVSIFGVDISEAVLSLAMANHNKIDYYGNSTSDHIGFLHSIDAQVPTAFDPKSSLLDKYRVGVSFLGKYGKPISVFSDFDLPKTIHFKFLMSSIYTRFKEASISALTNQGFCLVTSNQEQQGTHEPLIELLLKQMDTKSTDGARTILKSAKVLRSCHGSYSLGNKKKILHLLVVYDLGLPHTVNTNSIYYAATLAQVKQLQTEPDTAVIFIGQKEPDFNLEIKAGLGSLQYTFVNTSMTPTDQLLQFTRALDSLVGVIMREHLYPQTHKQLGPIKDDVHAFFLLPISPSAYTTMVIAKWFKKGSTEYIGKTLQETFTDGGSVDIGFGLYGQHTECRPLVPAEKGALDRYRPFWEWEVPESGKSNLTQSFEGFNYIKECIGKKQLKSFGLDYNKSVIIVIGDEPEPLLAKRYTKKATEMEKTELYNHFTSSMESIGIKILYIPVANGIYTIEHYLSSNTTHIAEALLTDASDLAAIVHKGLKGFGW